VTPARFSIAVIGGGAAAVTFLAQYVSAAPVPAAITVYADREPLGRGIAYGTDRSEHLLNVRAGNMSVFPDRPGHFAEWLQGRHPYGPRDFAPRMIYGEYLDAVLAEALEHAEQQGSTVTIKRERVTARPEADAVVLATGNAAPIQPEGAETVSEADGYFASPFSVDYEALKGGGEVVILGTGLSMVDAVLSFERAGFEGRITALSRRGLMPALHTEQAASWPAFVPDGPAPSVLALMRLIRAEAAKAEAAGVPWQAVIDSLRPFTNPVWESWSEPERRRFLRLSSLWNVHRHRMPESSAATIRALQAQGRLRIVRDRIISVGKDAGGLHVTGGKARYDADAIVNGLGYRAYKPLLEERPGTYAIGPARGWRLAETTAMPEVRQQAAEVVADIASRAKPF
jgi:uncharacterized NAD(P)/FAD-binding protein YdhS